MINQKCVPSSKQVLFMQMVIGVLLYSVVLGFFNDYTNILHTNSYSTTFAVAVVMQILTYLTFALKDSVVKLFSKKRGKSYKLGLALSVWLVLFLSKFVFLGAISVIFRQEVEISGFFGLIIIIVCMTFAQAIIEGIYNKLGPKQPLQF